MHAIKPYFPRIHLYHITRPGLVRLLNATNQILNVGKCGSKLWLKVVDA